MSVRLSAETVTAASAVLIGVCALGVSLYEASIMREQQRMSVWPYVEVGPGVTAGRARIVAYNQGIGPAHVRDVLVTVDGEPVPGWRAMLRAVTDTTPSFQYSTLNRRVLSAQTEHVAFNLTDSSFALPLGRAFLDGTVEVTVCYCSVYDECWRTGTLVAGRLTANEPVAACPAPSESSFQQ